jgi:hypothetical protein
VLSTCEESLKHTEVPMPDKEEQHQENEKKIKQLWELVKKLQEENERLKEKVRAFYGH